ncbi:MAG: cytochrome c oxidase subunit II [Actinomycetota bacterium]|nr:cytochrome c oxidase subunit II [Actinomycetota bacterium]MDH4353321.1 cytochrome c oxidase subunit II [Actinomycetota bacterium]MDH5277739.1 cytochrome c oxidase subunit II [Actinomycetota bacterium]
MISSRSTGRRPRRFAAAGLVGVVLLVVTGCSTQDIPTQLGIPDPVTDSGRTIWSLWQGTWVALWVVGAFTWALMLGAAVVYRRRRADEIPPQTRYNIPIEVLYTITPLIVIAVLTFFTWRDEAAITRVSDDQDLTVNVVGYQWNWGFNYVEDQVYDAGTPTDLATLYLPVDEKVLFELTSPDVIHSFWIPSFLFKMDVVPGRTNRFEVTPDTEGTFVGRCAEMCGTYHSQMLFYVKVVPRAEYDAHMAELTALGQTGQLETGRTSDEAQNQGNTRLGGQQ